MEMKQEDKEFLISLMKKGSTDSGEIRRIVELYKKYIDPNYLGVINYKCGNCSFRELMVIWEKLKTKI